MVSDCPYHKELLLKKEFAPFGSKFFPLRDVPIFKRDAIEENHCFFQLSPFDVCNLFSILAKDKKSGQPTVGFYGTLVLVQIKTCQKSLMLKGT